MKNNTKTYKIKTIKYIFIAIAIVLLFLNVSIKNNLSMAGGCVSIVLDKWSMLTADKVVISIDNKSYTITDKRIIRKVTKETMVATYHSVCYFPPEDEVYMWIDVYKKNNLVRSMQWGEHCEIVKVFEIDATHWILFGNGREGFVYLSDELVKELKGFVQVGRE